MVYQNFILILFSGGFGNSKIIANEGDNVRLRCAATGYPIPHVEWRRIDGKMISVGAWQGNKILFDCFFILLVCY